MGFHAFSQIFETFVADDNKKLEWKTYGPLKSENAFYINYDF